MGRKMAKRARNRIAAAAQAPHSGQRRKRNAPSKGERVVLERAPSESEDNPFATFTEWASEADEEAYRSL